MFTSLKPGWLPLSELCSKYEKDKGNMNRILEKISESDKEMIGKTWIVKESVFVENIKTDKDFEQDYYDKIEIVVDKFTDELAPLLTVTLIKGKMIGKNSIMNGDYILNTVIEWAVKCQIPFPIEIYDFMKREEEYTKFILISQLWNKTLKLSKKNKG